MHTIALETPTIGRSSESTRSERLSAIRSGRLGSVHSWELVTSVDGPGTRLTFFLSGCPLRCQYCHNPDTWRLPDGRPTTIAEVIARIDRYAPILTAAHGGVTLSGGEPLVQTAFAAAIFRHCREIGVHTALDTSGFLGSRADEDMLDDIDLVLLDVKSGLPENYRLVTGRELAPTLAFGRRLAQRGTEIWVRFVLVPGLTDSVDNVDAVADYVLSLQELGSGGAVSRVEVLPFHQMGRSKWQTIGASYPLEHTEPPGCTLLDRVLAQFRARGLTTF